MPWRRSARAWRTEAGRRRDSAAVEGRGGRHPLRRGRADLGQPVSVVEEGGRWRIDGAPEPWSSARRAPRCVPSSALEQRRYDVVLRLCPRGTGRPHGRFAARLLGGRWKDDNACCRRGCALHPGAHRRIRRRGAHAVRRAGRGLVRPRGRRLEDRGSRLTIARNARILRFTRFMFSVETVELDYEAQILHAFT